MIAGTLHELYIWPCLLYSDDGATDPYSWSQCNTCTIGMSRRSIKGQYLTQTVELLLVVPPVQRCLRAIAFGSL
jgi:hypothetical protein